MSDPIIEKMRNYAKNGTVYPKIRMWMRHALAKLDEKDQEISELKETLEVLGDKETMAKLLEAQKWVTEQVRCGDSCGHNHH